MLKGNLVVGKNQSVVLHAESLEGLLELAGTKHQGELGGEIRLRIDAPLDVLLGSNAAKSGAKAGSPVSDDT